MAKRRALTVDDIAYDPVAHRSTRPDGTAVEHVTETLAAAGLSTDFVALGDGNERLAAAIEYARGRGSAVHADCHAYDDDDLDPADVEEAVAPYVFDAWAVCRRNLGLRPLVRERRLYHPTYGYTGIMDGLFEIPRPGVLVLGDLKTGDPDDAAADLQTAAYLEAYLCTHTLPPVRIERWAIWLRPGLRIPYEIVNYSARPDAALHFNKFLACLTVYREQVARGKGLHAHARA